MVIPLKEWYQQMIKVSPKMYAFLSIVTLFSAGAFYELIEMWVALIVDPESGTTFIGLQGDEWDTQHDMELALYGSIFMIFMYSLFKKRKASIPKVKNKNLEQIKS